MAFRLSSPASIRLSRCSQGPAAASREARSPTGSSVGEACGGDGGRSGSADSLWRALGFSMAATAGDALSAVMWMAFAQGAQDLTLPVAWAVCVDVGHRYGGTATGFMNTASSASAVISPISAALARRQVRLVRIDVLGSDLRLSCRRAALVRNRSGTARPGTRP